MESLRKDSGEKGREILEGSLKGKVAEREKKEKERGEEEEGGLADFLPTKLERITFTYVYCEFPFCFNW